MKEVQEPKESKRSKTSRSRRGHVRGVNSAKGPYPPVVDCLDVDHMQVRVQVEVEREEQGIGETHGKEQSEEQREQIKRMTWMTMEMTKTRSCRHLSQCGVSHIMNTCAMQEKK